MKLNGGLDAIIETGKRLWLLGAVLLGIVLHIAQVNSDHKILVKVSTQVDTLSANYVPYRDFRFGFLQDQAERRKMWAAIERAEHRSVTHRDRPVYDPRYGPIPERMTDWFETYLDRGNE